MKKIIQKIFISFRPVSAVLLIFILLFIIYIFYVHYESNRYRNKVAETIYGQSLNFSEKIQKNNLNDFKKIDSLRNEYSYLKKFKLIKNGSGCFLYEINIKDLFSYKEWIQPISMFRGLSKNDCFKEDTTACNDYDKCKWCLTEDGVISREYKSDCK